jgi:tetratricopeptide (TPR) repeat protein
MFHYLRARLALDQGDSRTAVDAAKEAMVFDHRSAILHALLAEALLREGRGSDALWEAQRALELDPNGVEAHAVRADALWQAGRAEEAEGALQAVVTSDPTRWPQAERLLDLLVRRGDLSAALRVSRTVAAARGSDDRALLLLPETCARHARWSCASEHAEAAARQAPSSFPVCAVRAAVAEQRGLLDDAVAVRRTCLALEPDDVGAHLDFLGALARAGRRDDVRSHAAAMMRGSPGDTELPLAAADTLRAAHLPEEVEPLVKDARARLGPSPLLDLRLGEALADLGRCAEAEHLLAHPLPGEEGVRATLTRATCQLRRRDGQAALATLGGAGPSPSGDGRVVALRCRAWRVLGQPIQARAEVDRLDPAREDLAGARALCLVEAGEPAAAVSAAQAAAAGKAEDPEAQLAVADVQWRAGQRKEAAGTARALLAAHPGLPEAQNFLAYALLRSGGDVAEAVRLAQAAAVARPASGEVLDTLGEALLVSGRVVEALAHLERAVALLPHEPEVWLHLGRARRAAGQRASAVEAFKRGLALLPLEEWLEGELRAAMGGA